MDSKESPKTMKSNAMTSAERIEAALLGQNLDRLPFSPFLAYVWEHFPPAVQARGQMAFQHDIGADPLWRGAPCPVTVVHDSSVSRLIRDLPQGREEIITTPVGSLTLRWERTAQAANTLFLVEHPVRNVEDLKTLCYIEEHSSLNIDMTSWNRHVQKNPDGLHMPLLLPRCKSAFQSLVEHWVGTEQLAYLMVDHPQEFAATWKVMAKNDRQAAQLAADTGISRWWITWEDSSTQNYSPDIYRQFIAPEIAAWCSMLATRGQHYVQHACGHLRDLLPIMKTQGLAAVESLSPCPTGNLTLAQARNIMGPDLPIIGGIEPVTFLTTAEKDLEAYLHQVYADNAGGRLVLANSDSCPPGVTVEKFAIVAKVTRSLKIR